MKQTVLIFSLLITVTGLLAQSSVIEIHANNRVASLLMSEAEYASWIENDGFNNQPVREALFQDIYKKFDDVFDYIILILNEDEVPSNLVHGQLIHVSNAVQGIGLPLADETNFYGSSGKLKSVIQLASRDYLVYGPSLHELMHNWANFSLPTQTPLDTGTGLTSVDFQPHWGFTGGNTKGQLGGFEQGTLVDNGNGSYTVQTFGPNASGGNSVPYNELELYLMGLIPLSDVTPFDVFSDITSWIIQGDLTHFTASSFTTYTPASLESLLGPRNPDYTASQKEFKALVVVLTDTPLSPLEWTQLDENSESFSRPASDDNTLYNFWEATNGLATLETGNLQNSLLGVEGKEINNPPVISYKPGAGKIVFQVTDKYFNPEHVSIFTLSGAKIFNLKIMEESGLVSIDVSGLSRGVYFLSLGDIYEDRVTQKIIIK